MDQADVEMEIGESDKDDGMHDELDDDFIQRDPKST